MEEEKKVNATWESFKDKLYERAEKSDLGFRWLWREYQPIKNTAIEEMGCLQIGKNLYIVQVWDQGFSIFAEDGEGDINKIVDNLFYE